MGMLRMSNVWAIRRLMARFSLGGSLTANVTPAMSTTVQPITSMDDLLRDAVYKTATVASALTNVTLITVPSGKRWHVLAIWSTLSAGDRTLANWGVNTAAGVASEFIRLYSITPASNLVTGLLTRPIPLEQGWGLYANFTGGTTDGNWLTKVLALEEDAY